tara:strand:- start:1881 stop:2783 length:903 start_codon:yes stop_codon:yes gene_type:complete
MDGIQNILKAISKNVGRDLTKDTDSVKIIGKLIGHNLTEDMDLVKIIGKLTGYNISNDMDIVKIIGRLIDRDINDNMDSVKIVGKLIGRDITEDMGSIKIIGKLINRNISEDMDLIKIIGKVTDNDVVKSIVNSVNENQNLSKEWLVDNIKANMDMYDNPKICVAAGWYGMLADRMSMFTDKRVVSFDINSECAGIGKIMYPNVQFKTEDVNTFNAKSYDVIICTSCEHFSDDVLNKFLNSRDKGNCLVVLQSNNYFGLEEHVNCKKNLEEFRKSVQIRALNSLEKRINDKFDRYMLIGY